MTLIKPVITEKSMLSASRGTYTFQVALGATKSQVKQAVEATFKVKVVATNILKRHIPAKTTGPKRLRNSASEAKYATLRLAKGQTIALFDIKETASAGQGK